MNILDNVMKNIQTMTADDVIQALGRIYAEPVERDGLSAYPQFVQDAVFIIDLDTELNMEGISGLLENSTGRHIPKMITALRNIAAEDEAALLEEIYVLYRENPDDERISDLADGLYPYTDFDIWPLLEDYIEVGKNEYETVE
ncbi:MAG: DMP19 family protein [Treponema sp.]|jgi:hypothetical protein|nr:DMP19 family protein [Treponema sp.]